MNIWRNLSLGCGVLAGLLACSTLISPVLLMQTDQRSGGAASTDRDNQSAFATPVSGMTPAQRHDFVIGDHLFNTNWVIAPGSVPNRDGLGPLFNRVSCSGCHMRDGRGRPPDDTTQRLESMLIRISIPGQAPDGGPNPHPVYGGQIQEYAIPGVPAEARTHVIWHELAGMYADGRLYYLRQPTYRFDNHGYGVWGRELMISARVAPAIFGSGLLEAIPASDIMAQADPDDRNHDGVSGRVNMVRDVQTGHIVPGRFGWKAGQPDLLQQDAAAFLGDIGLTSPIFGQPECSSAQIDCLKAAGFGDHPEISHHDLERITDYIRMLAVPMRRHMDDPVTMKGAGLFMTSGCGSCHLPHQKTGPHQIPQLAHQDIWPYTDLLLHDMGPGLADHRPEFLANGHEWRTPPLWGIGLQPVVNGHGFYLHDGRARNLEEAILWHDGEARSAREAFSNLSVDDRTALIAFLTSL